MNTLKYHHLFNAEEEAPGNLQDKATPPRSYSASGEPHYDTPPAHLPTHHGSQTRRGGQASGYYTASELAEFDRMRGSGKHRLSRSQVITKLTRRGLAVALDKEHATMLEPRIEQTLTRLHEAFVNRFMRVITETYHTAKAGDIKLTDLMSLAYGSNTAEFHKKVADAEKEARLSLTRHTTQEKTTPEGAADGKESQPLV